MKSRYSVYNMFSLHGFLRRSTTFFPGISGRGAVPVAKTNSFLRKIGQRFVEASLRLLGRDTEPLELGRRYPFPIPKSRRPPDMRSSIAACSVSTTGLCQGSTTTAVPRRSARSAARRAKSAVATSLRLVPACEVVLDEEGGAIAERFRLDVELDKVVGTPRPWRRQAARGPPAPAENCRFIKSPCAPRRQRFHRPRAASLFVCRPSLNRGFR